jgi:hypothetical protein
MPLSTSYLPKNKKTMLRYRNISTNEAHHVESNGFTQRIEICIIVFISLTNKIRTRFAGHRPFWCVFVLRATAGQELEACDLAMPE